MSGMRLAKWLASLAPPRSEPTIGRPSSAAAAGSSSRVRLARVHARPGAHELRVEAHAGELGRHRGEHVGERVEAVGAQVADQLAVGGHDVEGLAGVQHGRHRGQVVGALGIGLLGDELGDVREREQGAAALVRRRAGVRGAAVGLDVQRAGGLALDDHGVLAVARALAGLEAEAGVEVREALGVGERRRAPLLVDDQQQRELLERLAAAWPARAAGRARSRRRPSCRRARAGQAVAVALERAVGGVGDDGVEVAEQQHPAAAGAAAGGRAGRRAQPGVEQGSRSRSTPGGMNETASEIAASAPGTSPDGEETFTSSSSSRSAAAARRGAISADPRVRHAASRPLRRSGWIVSPSGTTARRCRRRRSRATCAGGRRGSRPCAAARAAGRSSPR